MGKKTSLTEAQLDELFNHIIPDEATVTEEARKIDKAQLRASIQDEISALEKARATEDSSQEVEIRPTPLPSDEQLANLHVRLETDEKSPLSIDLPYKSRPKRNMGILISFLLLRGVLGHAAAAVVVVMGGLIFPTNVKAPVGDKLKVVAKEIASETNDVVTDAAKSKIYRPVPVSLIPEPESRQDRVKKMLPDQEAKQPQPQVGEEKPPAQKANQLQASQPLVAKDKEPPDTDVEDMSAIQGAASELQAANVPSSTDGTLVDVGKPDNNDLIEAKWGAPNPELTHKNEDRFRWGINAHPTTRLNLSTNFRPDVLPSGLDSHKHMGDLCLVCSADAMKSRPATQTKKVLSTKVAHLPRKK